jgi:hypothetical protein
VSINELDMKVKELRELRRMAEELQAEIDAAQDAIKAHMDSQGVDTLAGTDWKVRPNLPYPASLLCGVLAFPFGTPVHLRRCCSLLTLCIILHLNSTFNRHSIQCLSVILVQ